MSHSNQSLKHNTSAVTDSCVAHLIQVQGQSMTSSGGFSGCIMETLTIVNNSPPWYMASPLLPPPPPEPVISTLVPLSPTEIV